MKFDAHLEGRNVDAGVRMRRFEASLGEVSLDGY